jgi:hypothetical protein
MMSAASRTAVSVAKSRAVAADEDSLTVEEVHSLTAVDE